jgi:predicted ATP-binding protein involved in virulence
MRIAAVSVTDLFGVFNHAIPMNLNERITIIHGPNGYGKTVMLQMVFGFCNGEYGIFSKIPFHEFRINFDDKRYISLKRTEQKGRVRVTIQLVPSDEKIYVVEHPSASIRDISPSIVEDVVPSLRRVGPREWLERATDEVLSLEEVFERYAHLLPYGTEPHTPVPDWLKKIQSNIKAHYVRANRLIAQRGPGRRVRSFEDRETTASISTVNRFSEDLKEKIQEVILQSAALSQKLDRTFPRRLVAQLGSRSKPKLSIEQLRQRLRSLEEKRQQLVAAGLMEKSETDVQIGDGIVEEPARSVLETYVTDTEEKLRVYDDLQARISLLQGIINGRYAYSHKQLEVDKSSGFVIRTSNGRTLSPDALSSGEQHELVLFYELLFRVKPGSLILIDEPELSLHIAWQREFLSDLFNIIKLSGVDVLIATHSADIIYDRWSLAVELKGHD